MRQAGIYSIIAVFLLILSACRTVPQTETPTQAPPPTLPFKLATNTPTPSPTRTPTAQGGSLNTSEPEFVPACPPPPPECIPPELEIRDKFCVEKIPYTIVVMPKNMKYTITSAELVCQTEGLTGESAVLTCTGQPNYSYELEVCNSACPGDYLLADTNKCADGFGYDMNQKCCAPVSPSGRAGCGTTQIDIGDCPFSQ